MTTSKRVSKKDSASSCSIVGLMMVSMCIKVHDRTANYILSFDQGKALWLGQNVGLMMVYVCEVS